MDAGPMMSRLRGALSLTKADYVRLVLLFLASLGLVFLSHAFTREAGRIASIWPLNALLLAMVLRQPALDWRAVLCAGGAANIIVDLAMGDTLQRALLLTGANLVEVSICFLLLARRGEAFDITRGRPLARFIVVAGLAAPAASSLVAACALIASAPFLDTLGIWYAADALGLLIFTPALLALSQELKVTTAGARRAFEFCVSFAFLACVSVLVFGQHQYPLLFLIPPALTLATFRLGIGGAASGILLVTVFAIGFAVAGNGPTQLINGSATERILVLQLFLALVSLTTLPIAAALAQLTRARADLITVHAAAARSETHYRTLADYSTDLVVRLGPGGIISYASPACSMLGLTPEQAIGRSTLDFVAPEDRAFAVRVLEGLFTGAEPDRAIRREFRVRRPDGVVLWLEGNPSIIRDETGAPLNSIIGFSRVLELSGALGPTERRHAELVSASARSLLSIVNDVLDLSALDAGAIRLEQRIFSAAALVEQVIAAMRVEADAKAVTLSAQCLPPDAALVVGDEGRIRQALINLVGNAIKFTPSGSVTLDLRVETQGHKARRLRFSVTDTGIGIPHDKIGHLFQRFAQADASVSRRFGGSGLGLAITKNLIDLMQGRVGVVSEEGAGSTFWFEVDLPVAAETSGATDSASIAAGARRKLLVVDDVDVNRELLGLLLRGHDLDFAADGAEAVQCVRSRPYDLVLMDVQMAGMDGLAATRAVRSEPRFAALPIIAVSAHALPQQVAAFRAAGVNDYLPKPIEPAALFAIIDKWTGQKACAANAAPASSALLMEGLRVRFVARCHDDLAALRQMDQTSAPDAAQAIVHRLAGSAATFGFVEASRAALAADAAFQAGETPPSADMDAVIAALEEICTHASAA